MLVNPVERKEMSGFGIYASRLVGRPSDTRSERVDRSAIKAA
jgi:hypothetical protein